MVFKPAQGTVPPVSVIISSANSPALAAGTSAALFSKARRSPEPFDLKLMATPCVNVRCIFLAMGLEAVAARCSVPR